MKTANTVLGLVAALALCWRIFDPTGSYAFLFDVVSWAADTFTSSGLLINSISMLLLDQLNGILIGLCLTSIVRFICLVVHNSVTFLLRRGI